MLNIKKLYFCETNKLIPFYVFMVTDRERVIVWPVVCTDVCREVTGARAGREGSWGLGPTVAKLQGLAVERGAGFWSCAGGQFMALRKHLPSSKGIGRETSTISLPLGLVSLCPSA